MESEKELKEIDIKNCLCYQSDDTMRVEDFGFDNILLDTILTFLGYMFFCSKIMSFSNSL